MINNRPSVGEFTGYYNISESDFKKLSIGKWKNRVVVDDENLASLSSEEDRLVKDRILRLCVRAGFSETDLDDYVECLWPLPYVSVEREKIDRTVRIWVSTAKELSVELIELFVSVLNSHFPTWRIVLRLPRGDQPDAVIYRDRVRLGDESSFSKDDFIKHQTNWINSEQAVLPPRAKQFAKLNKSSPLCFLDNQHSIFMLNVFGESLHVPAPYPSTSTLWFASRGENGGTGQHLFSSLQTESTSVEPQTSCCPPGSLSPDNLWQFVSPKHAEYWCCYFLVKTPKAKTEFVLNGYDSLACKPWSLYGKFP